MGVTKRALLSTNKQNPDLERLIGRFDPQLAQSAHDWNRFSGGEFAPKVDEEKVDGAIVYVLVADTGEVHPEELYGRADILCQTAMDNGALEVVLLAPELHYSRADTQDQGRGITAELLAKRVAAVGYSRVIATDVHSPAVLDYYKTYFSQFRGIDLPQDRIVFDMNPVYAFAHHFYYKIDIDTKDCCGGNLVVVIPDAGRSHWGNVFIDTLRQYGLTELSWIRCGKKRLIPNDASSLRLWIEETSDNFTTVDGKLLLTNDDQGDKLGTLRKMLKVVTSESGYPSHALAYLSHLILSGQAEQRLQFYGINLAGTNSHPNIHQRAQRLPTVSYIDFTPAWFLAMTKAGENGITTTRLMRSYVDQGQLGQLYQCEPMHELVPLQKDNLMNGEI